MTRDFALVAAAMIFLAAASFASGWVSRGIQVDSDALLDCFAEVGKVIREAPVPAPPLRSPAPGLPDKRVDL